VYYDERVRENERKIKKMLESKLGYGFEYTELAPELRGKLRKLAEDLRVLNDESRKYELMVRGLDYAKVKECDELRNKYTPEIEALTYKLHELEDALMMYVNQAKDRFRKLFVCCLHTSIFLVTVILIYSYGLPGLLFGLALYGAHILYVLSPLISPTARKEIKMLKKEGREIKKAVDKLNDELRSNLDNVEYKYRKLKAEWPNIVKAQGEKVELLRKDFDERLDQLASEIGVFFEEKESYEHIRLLLKTRGLIIEEIACPHCGGKLKLPESGNVIECPYCGRSLYAIEVLKILDEKLRKKIGKEEKVKEEKVKEEKVKEEKVKEEKVKEEKVKEEKVKVMAGEGKKGEEEIY